MQTIELSSSSHTAVDLQPLHTLEAEQNLPFSTDLDEALARLVRTVRSTDNEADMDALGVLLGYMEMLEKKQSAGSSKQSVYLENPVTLTL
ncbi:MAG: hypothetical protein R3194_08035 [Limnobacter sp.]|nr:hypothetical protein [Limnobacter sp.]